MTQHRTYVTTNLTMLIPPQDIFPTAAYETSSYYKHHDTKHAYITHNSAMHNTAASKVLQIPELTERILSHLPPLDILTSATRVCHHWHATITSSPTIQTKLWMRPQARAPISPYTIKPIYAAEQPLRDYSSKEGIRYAEQSIAHYRAPMVLNEFLYNQVGGGDGFLKSPKVVFCFKHGMVYGKRLREVECKVVCKPLRGSGGYEQVPGEASWRKMFLTEPPVTTVVLLVNLTVSANVLSEHLGDSGVRQSGYLLRACVRDLEGVRLGPLRDVADRMVEDTLRCARGELKMFKAEGSFTLVEDCGKRDSGDLAD